MLRISPHSGRSIPIGQLVHVLRTIYNFSAPFAWILSILGFILCGHFTGSGLSTRLALDLHDLARHNRIEHNASLGHADVAPGEIYAPTVPDSALLASLVDAGSVNAGGKGPVALTFFDLARVRFLRNSTLARPLDAFHAFVARGETALVLLAMGVPGSNAGAEGAVVPRERLVQWFGQERLPEGWHTPMTQIGLRSTGNLAAKVKSEVARLARYA